ncbi:hypothetical protein PhCBS80983_g05864 [Powellomyces hirtus]|uniref:histidine kinase n=1 Tax=Powellomyces hirtus TaxID=109895 RepID=A0A507DST0_9FUNG|nr:hypothetical protein PhCBS80983_g05864 [Powellomyces hirtus]
MSTTSSTVPLDLRDGGEMGRRTREFDWSKLSVGPREKWPPALTAAVNMILTSRFPFLIRNSYLPSALENSVVFYNDAYIQVMGPKHPALGLLAVELWGEIWQEVGPDFARALNGVTTYSSDMHLPMFRMGYTEETYFTYSISPILSDHTTKTVGGILAPSFEVTGRVIHERREHCVRELGSKAGTSTSLSEACSLSAECLALVPFDISFSMIYFLEADQMTLSLKATSGIDANHALAVPTIFIGGPMPGCLERITDVLRTKEAIDIPLSVDLGLPGGAWPEKPVEAMILPILKNNLDLLGIAVLGASPRRRLDALYRNFFTLIVRQLSHNLCAAQSYEEERQKRETLAELDRAKTTFFSNISHELRTPLTLILGPVEEMLRGNSVSATIRKELEIVQRNALRLLKLVTSLLDFSRIEAGRMQVSYRPTILGHLVVDPVYVHKDFIEKMMYNLLSNALKCTFTGRITVLSRQVDQQVEISVSDTGVGILDKDLPEIFKRFYRVEGGNRRSNEGTGIGLALSQELAKLHGGTITAKSTFGEGSTLTLTIPLGRSHLPSDRVIELLDDTLSLGDIDSQFLEEAMGWLSENDDALNSGPFVSTKENPSGWSPTCSSTTGAAAPEPYVLVADDNNDMSAYVKSLLSKSWRVRVVRDGQEALDMCERHPPGLLVSDIMMPRLSGLELVKHIRADPVLRLIPIILLSARAGEEARVEGLESGADDYMCKPFSGKELIARVRTHLELGRLRSELMHLARVSPVGIFRADASGNVTYRSERMLTLSGGGGKDPALSNVHPDDFPEWSPESDETGGVVGFLGAVTDISERVEMQQQQLNEAEENRKSQESFIDMISHEIRNPISGILGSVDLLRRGIGVREKHAKRSPEGREEMLTQIASDVECLDAIHSCATHQRLIADDVLNLSKLKSGSFAINDRLFDPVKTIGDTVNMFKALMEAKSLSFTSRMDWAHGKVHGDPERLSQVMINLLGNAIKFTEKCTERRIDISLSSRPGDEPTSIMLCVDVRDTGIGMSQEVQEKLFQRFSQATIRTYREYGGSGLGLHLSKQMVQVMGGDIGVESDLGKGTKISFYVRVERKAPTVRLEDPVTLEPQSPIRRTPDDGNSGAQISKQIDEKSIAVLVVEDNLINQRVLRRQLDLAGFVTLVANNGEEALQTIRKSNPVDIDVILMDIEMPVMDGTEATLQIRDRESRLGIDAVPIVGLSGNAREEHRERALQCGMTDYITKPCQPNVLYSLIRALAEGRRGRR